MPELDDLSKLKRNIREAEYPYFTDDAELTAILEECEGDVKKASYRALIVKAENTAVSVSGFEANDTSKYFLRLANHYRPRNSGTLIGG